MLYWQTHNAHLHILHHLVRLAFGNDNLAEHIGGVELYVYANVLVDIEIVAVGTVTDVRNHKAHAVLRKRKAEKSIFVGCHAQMRARIINICSEKLLTACRILHIATYCKLLTECNCGDKYIDNQ